MTAILLSVDRSTSQANRQVRRSALTSRPRRTTSFASDEESSGMAEAQRTTIDHDEVERFSALAAEWWNPNGKFRPLHRFNPVRLAYIRDQVATHFGRDPHAAKPFDGLRILDIGCGGGL